MNTIIKQTTTAEAALDFWNRFIDDEVSDAAANVQEGGKLDRERLTQLDWLRKKVNATTELSPAPDAWLIEYVDEQGQAYGGTIKVNAPPEGVTDDEHKRIVPLYRRRNTVPIKQTHFSEEAEC